MDEEQIKKLKRQMYLLTAFAIWLFVVGLAYLSKLMLEFAQYLDNVVEFVI